MLLSLVGITVGADNITLRHSLTNSSTSTPSNTAENPGGTIISDNKFINYSLMEAISGSDKHVAHLTGDGHFSIGSTDSSFGGMMAGGSKTLNTTDGFTLVFNGYAPNGTTGNWADFLSFTVGSTQYKFETGDTTNIKIYTPSSSGGVSEMASMSGVNRETWYNFALTALGSGYTLSVWDASGTKVGSCTFTGATGNLNYLYEGSTFEQHWDGKSLYLANFGVYDGVLTDDNLAALVRSEAAGTGMIQSYEVIPEPATATLSLLALAGLALRRRRK